MREVIEARRQTGLPVLPVAVRPACRLAI